MNFVDTRRGIFSPLPACACSHGADSADLEGPADLEDMFCPQDDSFTCHGTYFIKQSDMDFGSYNSTSDVTAVSPNGSLIEDYTNHSAVLIGAASIWIGERGATSI